MDDSVAAETAMARARANQYRRWGGRLDKVWANEAAARLKTSSPIEIGHTPRFKLPRQGSVFTIGSCFARNIEQKLADEGIDVPSLRFQSLPGIYKNKDMVGPPNSVLNKFTVHSISNEFARVLEGAAPPNRGFIPEGDDLWFDPQATHSGPMEWDRVNAMRDAIEATTATVRQVDAVFITLGLTESWLDTQTGVYFNGDLPHRLMVRHPGRFQYVNPGFDELLTEGRRVVEMIQAHGKPDVKIVMTVSPVPLATTFSDQDIIVANNYSKSVLRVVAQTLRSMQGVDYFPSYEMVVFSARETAWAFDQRHVEPALVDSVTSRFIELYLEDAPQAPA
jgi:hypothetical protein